MKSIVSLRDAVDLQQFGGKATNLAQLLRNNLPVPDGFAVGLTAFAETGLLTPGAKQGVEKFLEKEMLYAVRSSALAEDASGASWAGQFETFLEVEADDVIAKIEECHNSKKARAKAYADKQQPSGDFEIAVVVQKMLKPTYAGVLFTKDPISGADKLVTEYIEGLGEDLVSGKADPLRLEWLPGQAIKAPFDIDSLSDLASRVEQIFGLPQDIEWAWTGNKIWLVQARPITTLPAEASTSYAKKSAASRDIARTSDEAYYLGKPDELFYWGPSRAKPLYMSDFMAAVEQFFIALAQDPNEPQPPKTIVLFHDGKMVWLNKAQAFSHFTEALFLKYEKRDALDKDLNDWRTTVTECGKLQADAKDLVKAWNYTLFGEFSLYAANSILSARLKRFDDKTYQEIWGAFTLPDTPTFLAKIDKELQTSGDPSALASQYPWIVNGYSGCFDTAEAYFTKRLKVLSENIDDVAVLPKKDRLAIAQNFGLQADEVKALDLSRGLAEFMDERKTWMMRTRSYIKKPASAIKYGWLFDHGEAKLIDEEMTEELWKNFVDFKASSSVVSGIVASNGGRHFINGEVAIATGPTDLVPDDSILVVPATSPTYVPLMRKARALVTDHGGMMSHAAIVAREFNLPCIVGTQQATKVLKNGDKVVLDFVKGVVSR